jgi:ABC-type uncharacterized transport system involved in gliding motility auxiliary subunit
MDRSPRSGLILLAGVALLAAAGAVHAILLKPVLWNGLLAAAGAVLLAWGVFALRGEWGAIARQRRGEIALHTLGAVGALVALAYLSVLLPWRYDMTTSRKYSLSEPTLRMLRALGKPVNITFFYDPMMRETVELYQLVAKQNARIKLTLLDPVLNPAQARMMNVQFAGTTIMQSEDRKLQINGYGETDIANGVLRVSQGAKQRVCFLDGHGEPNPFSMESHDHLEGTAGHSHGLGQKLVLHQEHGMAKARNALENLGYGVEKISLVRGGDNPLPHCAVLIVAGPKTPLLPTEVAAIRGFLGAGGNALFMLDPFVRTGLEPVLPEYSIVADDNIVVDDTDHFWTDPSAPAVTEYNYHPITRDLPLTFFPGARSLSPTPQRVPGTTVTPIVNSSKQSYGQTSPERAQFKEGTDKPGPATLMVVAKRKPGVVADAAMTALLRLRGEAPQSATDAGAGAGKGADDKGASANDGAKQADAKQSRIAVVGDSDFATNSFFHLMGNGALFLNTVNYLAAQENLIGIEPRTYDLPRVNLTNRQMKGTFFLSVVLIPLLLAIIGTAVWWKQR